MNIRRFLQVLWSQMFNKLRENGLPLLVVSTMLLALVALLLAVAPIYSLLTTHTPNRTLKLIAELHSITPGHGSKQVRSND